MYYKSKKVSLIILAITALVGSRLLFALFNDPEGPNLLVVTVGAAIIYFLSLGVYVSKSFSSLNGGKRLSLMIFVQILIVTVFYLLLG